MTQITVDIQVPSATGNRAAAGYLVWTPTRRRYTDTAVVLPNPFTVRLVDGKASFTVDTTTAEWLWKVDEVFDHQPQTTIYVTVHQDNSFYADLARVDPITMEPFAEPSALWWETANNTIQDATLSGDELLFTRYNGEQVNAGNVRGRQGTPGQRGLPGKDGADGADGADGVDSQQVAVSPRDTFRGRKNRKRIATVDRSFPNEITDHRIVWAEGNTLYGIGRDRSLRSTLDNGYTWSFKLSNSGELGQWAMHGLFYRTTVGSFITTYHPDDLSAPSIVRSSNNGVTFTTTIVSKPNVSYLGPSSICQDPNTGYLYLVEYVTVDATTAPTWSVMRSTDDGATWSAFHTFNRAGVGAVRHGHSVQYDPISQRVYFITGDGEPAAGIYRTNSAGSGVEPVVTNATISGHPSPSAATAVAIMFFPDYIAWGMDGTSDAHLLRLPRTQIGQATPQVEQIMRLQNTAWWVSRASADNTAWLMVVSNEVAAAGRVDDLVHVYAVGDNAATIDEVLAVSGDSGLSSGFAPVGTPLQTGPTIWLAATRWKGAHPNNNGLSAFQIGVRLGWGDGPMLSRPDTANGKLFYAPETVSDGKVSLVANGLQVIGATEVPAQARRLYIINMGVYNISGTGSPAIRLFNLSTNDTVKYKGTTTPISYGGRDYRTISGEDTAPYIGTTDMLTKGHRILVQAQNTSTTDPTDATMRLTFAWGF